MACTPVVRRVIKVNVRRREGKMAKRGRDASSFVRLRGSIVITTVVTRVILVALVQTLLVEPRLGEFTVSPVLLSPVFVLHV